MDLVSLLAQHAYQNWPFYRWFYEKRGLKVENFNSALDVPLFTKHELFQYEFETKNKYWESSLLDNIEDITFLATTGTTGRVLLIPYQGHPNVTRGIARALQQLNCRRFGMSLNIPLYMNKILSTLEQYGIDIVHIPPSKTSSELKAFIKEKRIDAIFDIATDISRRLFLNKTTLMDIGIKCIFSFDKYALVKWNEAGVVPVPFYGSADQPYFYTGCQYSNSVHLISEPIDLVDLYIQDENQTFSSEGIGLLVGTVGYGAFPFINYSNGDIVQIFRDKCPCGFQGRSLHFIERKGGVKVGDEGPVLDLNNAYVKVTSHHNGSWTVLLVVSILEENHPRTGILTVVEGDVSSPALVEDGWKEVMEGGGGVSYGTEHYKHLLPYVIVPQHLIPKEGHKHSPYRNLKENCSTPWLELLNKISISTGIMFQVMDKKII